MAWGEGIRITDHRFMRRDLQPIELFLKNYLIIIL
jgi:hypothetical protein